ncbi:hypothetical protein SAMN05216266_10884 [Amycolatopsis marina]|uniref:Excreted virulence factor EspC, type VII ESX diderm n=1 Tax=Amycolatopsis marina TaxID=490629 RepID=A0A1I1A290_9PSEU|nr:hypothetical protein [Amycolatopsis marina]SFB31632.1 hypothetical protein SAMN05216266_10884 [Amycolatopsis marina]
MGAQGEGYKTDADAMAAASKRIAELAEDLPDDNKDLGDTKVNAAGFGEAHGEHATSYTTGVSTLDAAVKGLGTTLNGFAGRIGGAGTAYTAGDDARTGDMNAAGRQ